MLPVAGKGLADSLGEALDAYVSVHQGCITSATIAAPEDGSLHDPVSGEPGVRVEVRTADGAVASDARFPTSVLTWWDDLPAAVHLPDSEVVMRARYRPRIDGPHVLGVAGVGMLRVLVDGTPLAEAKTEVRRDSVQALSQPPELRCSCRPGARSTCSSSIVPTQEGLTRASRRCGSASRPSKRTTSSWRRPSSPLPVRTSR